MSVICSLIILSLLISPFISPLTYMYIYDPSISALQYILSFGIIIIDQFYIVNFVTQVYI